MGVGHRGCDTLFKNIYCRSSRTQREFNIDSFINCNTSYVVYLLMCTHCGVQYLGCTTRLLKNRMEEHLNQIEAKSDATTIKVNNRSRGGNKVKKLLELEVKWIFILDRREPNGLNVRWDVSCHV
ncbi:hypothetical protein XELAEV_18008431mg [Xenopus laevis]|uniref:GIY-YIG domain-containing protein n=1 Tax=Xenopus laevis TaxID=8355 RepID=A0A974I5L8_XENLA|nr:hypothetical protein XELAEV_18008431mg [Xenopus laevis]